MSNKQHPTELVTREDYESAPTGTIVAGDHADPWVKDYMGFWLPSCAAEGETSLEMSLPTRRVLRWGETLYPALDNAHAAVAEIIRLRQEITAMRDRHLARIDAANYITDDVLGAQFIADDLTRILEGDTE